MGGRSDGFSLLSASHPVRLVRYFYGKNLGRLGRRFFAILLVFLRGVLGKAVFSRGESVVFWW
jgi:hypothetical protein